MTGQHISMSATLTAPRPGPSALRALADQAADLPGYRIEVFGGAVAMTPFPPPRQGGVVRRIERQLGDQLPADRVAWRRASVDGGRGEDEFAGPDLTVVPIVEERRDGWLISTAAVSLAAEIVWSNDAIIKTRIKPAMYADWGIPIYLLVDPRDGTIVLYSDPVDGVYQGTHRMRFGDTVELPEPLKGIAIETADLPRYPAGG